MFIFHNIWDVILPIDELIFFKMVKTANQLSIYSMSCDVLCFRGNARGCSGLQGNLRKTRFPGLGDGLKLEI
jgi:hypothetical protein